MAWHLQRIACLPAKTLETNEYTFSQLESVKCEPLYNLLLNKMPESMPRGARVRPINTERETRVREIYADETARRVIQKYLEGLRAAWGSYIDSASGDERRIDGQAISLLLLKSKCFDDICDSDDAAKEEDMICPISQKIMRDPVKCSDGLTYERKYIEKWAHEQQGTSPKTREILEFDEQGDVKKVCCRTDTEILEKIKQFKEEKRKELEDLKQSAEGEEEKRILRSRLGYTWRDGDSKGRKEDGLIDAEEEEFQSAETFLQNLLSKTGTGLACLTGPPASGKTVTMQKIVCTHAATQTPDIQMEEDGTSAVLPIPLLPLFMRAAELSKLLSETGKDAADLSEYLCDTGKENMRYLVELFLDKSARQELFPVDFKNCILELFDNDHALICIDGLDEAAPYQDLVEDIIDKHVAEKSSDGDVRMLISTREHSYVNSRKLRRLADFDVVKLQPLGKDQQLDMIKGRLIGGEQVETFLQQLAGIADKNPELATSPFLLSLMIEVYKNDGSIPSQRVTLYAKQVKAIVLRCIATRTEPVALEVATGYLEILAFVCQGKRSQRDFSLAECADDVKVLWKHTPDDLDLARECLFGTNMVGLLTRVGEDIYRFSHLTLQEYLAATCAVRLFGLDAKELVNQLQPLHSPWKRMVVQFAACLMEDEEVFKGFCQLVLASDDGTGSHCELVQDFLKERDASAISEKVERMVRGKLQEIRGSGGLIAGLCHPSSEVRRIVLSEMKKFGVPPDPFAETDGTAAALRQIAEDGASKWHKRAAAVLSLVQMAQMDHCRKGNGRSDTLQWLLGMLKPDQSEDIRFVLVAGLGTLLKGFNQINHEIMLFAAEDEPVLLGALKQSANGVVVEAVADLKAYSDGLMDWVSKESTLIAEGVWPMRHLLHVFCSKTATSGNQDRAEKLGQQLFGRVHAVSEETFNKEQGDVLKGLDMICPAMRDDRLPLFLHLLRSGEVKKRSRVVQVAAELGIQFVSKSRESLDTLAQALLSDVDEGCTLAGLMEGGSLLAALLRDESYRKHKSFRQSSKVFVYLMESLGPTADQALEAPKRVVDFLVEFKKNHLASAAAAASAPAAVAAAAVAVAGNRNETKPIEKSQETNPEEKGKEDKKHSEDLSLKSLASAVEDLTPRDLSTRIRRRRSEELPSWTGVMSASWPDLSTHRYPLYPTLDDATESLFWSADAGASADVIIVAAPRAGKRWASCPHFPPYADVRVVVPGDFLNRNGQSYPDGVNHYTIIGRCQGTKKDGTPCEYKCMLQNAYLPVTRFRLANGEIFNFTSWVNPLACGNQSDVVKAAQVQVEGKRGWHKFWFAVHHIGAHVSGQQHASQDKLELWTSWLRDKAKDFNSNMNDFQNAGLLVEGGPGDGDAGVRDKFMRAQHVLQHCNVHSSAKRFKKKLEKREPSPGPATAFEVDFDRPLKQDLKMPQSPTPAPADFSDPRTFIDVVSQQSLSCPRSQQYWATQVAQWVDELAAPAWATQVAQACVTQVGAASSHADRDVQDDVSPHAGQDVQPWWETPDPKKESGGAAKMRERPQEEHAGTVGAVGERADCKSLQTLFKSDKARISVDFHSFERSQAIHLQVEEILDGQHVCEAEDFADLISPVFRVVLQGASGGKVPDGQTVDLIVELEDVEDNLNTDSLVFIKKSEELEGMWCGVSGGTFDLVPSDRGKGPVLRGRVATDSFSWWGVAKYHVKVAAHHVEVDTERGHRRKLRFIVYSGAPVWSYPIPRNTCLVRKDSASSRNTLVPMLRGFFMYQHSQAQEEIVLKDGLEFTIQVQGKKNGVVISSSAVWRHGRSIDWEKVEIDVHDIDLDSELQVKILRQSMGWLNRIWDGNREFTLMRQHFNRNVLPREWETCTSLGYWCNLDEYTGPQKSITCGYCLSCNEEQSEMVCVTGLGARIKLGGCCKIVENELLGQLSTSADAESETRGGKVPQVRDQGMIDIIDRYALLIGNSQYHGTLRDGVSRCTKDAEDMARQLACDTLGVYKFTTMVLVNKTKQEIENSIREWARGLPRRCVALFKFAGHGLEIQGKNYLLPVDAPENMLEAEIEYKCISLDWIMTCILQQLDRESLIIALLDCCREETFTRGLRTLGGTGKRGLGPVNLSDPDSAAVFVGYAAAPGMVAMERPQRRNGNFTDALLFALKDHEISRKDISIFFRAVVDNVLTNEPRRQRPHSENNMTKGFAFRPS